MERPQKAPTHHGDVKDPKLPVIHGQSAWDRGMAHACPAPLPLPQEPLQNGPFPQ